MEPWVKSKKGNRIIFFITDLLTNITKVIKLQIIYSLAVTVVLAENWLFRNGISVEVLSDDDSNFASKFFLGCAKWPISSLNSPERKIHKLKGNQAVKLYDPPNYSMLRLGAPKGLGHVWPSVLYICLQHAHILKHRPPSVWYYVI